MGINEAYLPMWNKIKLITLLNSTDCSIVTKII